MMSSRDYSSCDAPNFQPMEYLSDAEVDGFKTNYSYSLDKIGNFLAHSRLFSLFK